MAAKGEPAIPGPIEVAPLWSPYAVLTPIWKKPEPGSRSGLVALPARVAVVAVTLAPPVVALGSASS